ncbi:MAG: VWA domain-containing protein [Planctomycetia bacterium]|nr:VWA domain-containing protein [Planctomycetia bacterium]
MTTTIDEKERLQRWRLILGKDAEEETMPLDSIGIEIDSVLASLYNMNQNRKGKGSLDRSSPAVHRWLGDIRKYFPKSVVRVMQKDAINRLGLEQMLLEPELLEVMEPDIHLVSTLLSLGQVIPSKTKATARIVVKKLVDELMNKLATKTIQAIKGSINRAARTNHPRSDAIDFDRTIRINLKNWQPEKKSLIVERLAGYGRKQHSLRDIILCVDQSGSMATSVIYSSIFAAVIASLRSVSTKMVVFDTAVADLSDLLQDPVEVLFGTQLGGGTDINLALAYCQKLITRPNDTILVMITDLCEGGNEEEMFARAHALVQDGVNVVCLLSLSDEGTPSYDEGNAAKMAQLGIPAFACTPDLFPDLMAAAINHQDIVLWAGQNNIRVGADLQTSDLS